jgi:hypothetical protein
MFQQSLPWFLSVFVLTTVASYIVGMIAHEFGHAGMAWLVGLSPRLIRIGEGPMLVRFRMGRALFDMRRWPLYGYVAYLPAPRGRIWARILRLSGGFLVNALILAAMFVLWSYSDGLDDRAFWAISIGNAQLSLIASAVIPFSRKWRGQTQVSDMLSILRLLRHPQTGTLDELYAAQMRRVLPAGALVPAPSADAPEIIYYVTRRDRLSDPWGRRDVSAGLREVLARGTPSEPERALILQNLALIERHKGDEGSLELMDAWSQEAVALAPCASTLVTRGGVLLSLGRPAEALALLRPVVEAAAAIGWGPLCQAYINLAEVQLRHAPLTETNYTASLPS